MRMLMLVEKKKMMKTLRVKASIETMKKVGTKMTRRREEQ